MLYANQCAIYFTYFACYSYCSGNQSKRDERKRGQGGCHFLFVPFSRPCGSVLVSCLLLGHLVPLGVLVVFIVRWRGGEGEGRLMVLRSQLHGNSQHGHAFGRTLYPAPGLIPTVPRESWSVTEQINVYCFLSRLDRPMLTAEAVILPATVEYGMMVHQCALRICELHQ